MDLLLFITKPFRYVAYMIRWQIWFQKMPSASDLHFRSLDDREKFHEDMHRHHSKEPYWRG